MKMIAEIFDIANQYALELPPSEETMVLPVGSEINAFVDHTLLKPERYTRTGKEVMPGSFDISICQCVR